MSGDETNDPPLFGPALFHQRRAQWLTPRENASSGPPSSPPPPSITRLETLLAKDGIEEDEKIWRQHLAEIHRSLVGGSRLKKGLKLSWVVSPV